MKCLKNSTIFKQLKYNLIICRIMLRWMGVANCKFLEGVSILQGGREIVLFQGVNKNYVIRPAMSRGRKGGGGFLGGRCKFRIIFDH